MKQRITIAGAGIGGMSAAINLAKAGFRVKVLERRSEVGSRFSKDFQFFENWTQKEDVLRSLQKMNIEINFPVIPIYHAKGYDNKYNKYQLRSKKPVMYMVKRGPFRGCLDFGLKEQAVEAGVEFGFNEKTDPNTVDIIATGPSKESLVYVNGVHFKTNIDYDIRVIFNSNIAPYVYAYMVVYESDGIICTAYTREFKYKKSARSYIEDAIKAFQNTGPFEMTDVIHFGNYGISPLIKRHTKIVIGEAAGFQDLAWGFGMRLAVISGYLAAQSIIENEDYWNLINEHILPYIETSAFNRFIFERFENLSSTYILKRLASSKDSIKVLTSLYKPSLFKKCLFKFLEGYFKRRQRSNVKRKGMF